MIKLLKRNINYLKREGNTKDKNSEKAITLIALVITIIVLLILARYFNKYAIWR